MSWSSSPGGIDALVLGGTSGGGSGSIGLRELWSSSPGGVDALVLGGTSGGGSGSIGLRELERSRPTSHAFFKCTSATLGSSSHSCFARATIASRVWLYLQPV